MSQPDLLRDVMLGQPYSSAATPVCVLATSLR